MCDTYPSVTQETCSNGAQLPGYSINSPPLQRKATAQSTGTEKVGGTELASPTVQDVHFRRLGGNRKARESFNRLSVEFEADTPEDAKTYTERFASAKALFENMTRSPIPAIESANRQNRTPFKSRIVNANAKPSPPVVPMKPIHLTKGLSQDSKSSPTSLLPNGDVGESHRLPAVASNLNRLLPDSPTRKRVSESDTSQDGNILEELGPRQSPDGQAAPDDSSSMNSSSTNNVEPQFFEPSLNFQKSSSQESSTLGTIGESEVKVDTDVEEVIKTIQNLDGNQAEVEPAVYAGTIQEKFLPVDASRPQVLPESEDKSADVDENREKSNNDDDQENEESELVSDKNVVDHVVPKAIADDLLKEDTETEENDDSNSVNEDEYDLGNEAADEVAMSGDQATSQNKADESEVLEKGPEEVPVLANEERVLDEEEQLWWGVYEGLLDVDEIDGLPPAEEDELVVEDDQMTRKKTIRFSDDKIKVSYTYSMHELDRRNDQIDPVGASAEYELEKRIDKMTLFEVELDKTNSGLGLSIIGMGVGADAGVEKLGIFIKTMNPTGAAAQSGKIAVGDMIIEVNGQSLVGVTQVFAASVLKSTENVVRFLLGREQENGEISRLLQQEEQAAAAAAQNSAQYRAHNVNQSHHGTGNDESSILQDGLLEESLEDLSPTTENFEKLKMLYQYSESSRSVEQEEREHALMQLDRVQAERDELGGRVVPRLEAQLTSVQDQLHQTLQRLEEVTERKDEVEKKYQKAKRIIRDLNSDSNEMKDHVRSVKEQMSVMKEEFQQENFTLHERIATLEAQLLQSQQQVTQLQNERLTARDFRDQEIVAGDGLNSLAAGDSMSFTNVTGLGAENETSDHQFRTMSEARNRNSYVESQFNQVIQLLETRPSRISRYGDDACISDDEILDGPSNRNSNRYSRPISGMSAGTNSTSVAAPTENNRPPSSASAQTNSGAPPYDSEMPMPPTIEENHNHRGSNMGPPYAQDNSDSSSTGSGSYGPPARPHNFPVGGTNDLGKTSSPLAFQHEYQNSTGSSKSFTDRLRSSFTKQGKYVVNAGSPTTPPANPSYATSTPLEPGNVNKGSRDGAAGFPNKYQPREVEIDGSKKVTSGSNSALNQPSSPLGGAAVVGNNHLDFDSPSVNETDVKQMLYKLNLSKYYPMFQRNHIDANNLSELAHGDKLKDIGIADKKDREAIKHHIKERNKLINKDSKLKSKSNKKVPQTAVK